MTRPRLIPVLLLRDGGLRKGIRFRDHAYVGDPMNTLRILNEKEADEILLLDVAATAEGRTIPLDLVRRVAEECYMPFGVGGGIRTVEAARDLLRAGAEKVSLNTAAVERPDLVAEASAAFGAQSVVVSIDARRTLWGGTRVHVRSGTRRTRLEPAAWAAEAERLGAGEILLTSIDRDGTRKGYDIGLVRAVAAAVRVPVIACGGAGAYRDLARAIEAGAAAAAAGTIFVMHGPHRGVLVQYPDEREREEAFYAH
jgi:cyclase